MGRPIRLGLIVVLFCSNMQAAVAATADDALQFFDEEALVILAAARHAQKTGDAPADVYIITKQDIEKYGYRTLGEALQSVPGIFTRSDHNYSYISIDGLGLDSDFNAHVLLLVNGHRINDQDIGQAHYDQLFSVNMKSVERVEVVKGPGAALYGDNAFLGVINVVTKTAKTAPRLQADAEIGSYGAHEEFLGLAKQFENGVDVYASGTYHFMKGQDFYYDDLQVAANHSDREEAYNLFTTVSGTVAGTKWEFMGNAVNRNKQDPVGSSGAITGVNGTYNNDAYGFVQLKLEKEIFNNVTLAERSSYDWYYYHGDYIWPNFFTSPPPDTIVLKVYDRETWWGQEVTARLTPFGEENALTVGVDYQKTIRDHQVDYTENPPLSLTDEGVSYYRWSLFAQQELRLAKNLEANLGVRYDNYEDFGHTINPRSALIYHPWEDGSLKLIYATAFVAPTPFEVQGNIINSSFNGIPLQRLSPEMIRSYQVVYEHDFHHRGSATIRYFQNRISDLIRFDWNVIQDRNMDNIRTDGVELASKMDLGWNLSGYANYMVQRTHDMGGDRRPNSPTQLGTLGLSKRLSGINNTTLSTEAFFISAHKTFQQAAFAPEESGVPAFALLSVNIRTQPWMGGPVIYAGVHNITDAPYRLTASSPSQNQNTIPQNGRNFNLGLEYRFK